VFEDLAVKQSVLLNVESKAKAELVFASNTSSIPIAKIAERAARPENVVGMHYFSPVHKMQLLEVVRAPKTAPSTVATAVAIGKKQGKTVIVVGDGPGFYTTRVLAPYLNEACWLLSEGMAVDAIDRALVAWGWPVGPLALVDEVGIDIAEHVVSIVHGAFGERLAPPPAVARLCQDGRKGRKNERGLYLYGERAKAAGKGKHVDPTAYAVLGLSGGGTLSAEEMQMRCALAFVNEAAHCLGEGILRSARDGDVGAILGLGFPPFRGGPFRFVDAVGATAIVEQMRGYEQRFGARFTPAPLLVEGAAAGRRIYG
jgi:3-hydroxyacyl-CoA dehydrogenase / enoyl-CoA hydratase / 3-hydroxybutyryl-CoA epimerase